MLSMSRTRPEPSAFITYGSSFPSLSEMNAILAFGSEQAITVRVTTRVKVKRETVHWETRRYVWAADPGSGRKGSGRRGCCFMLDIWIGRGGATELSHFTLSQVLRGGMSGYRQGMCKIGITERSPATAHWIAAFAGMTRTSVKPSTPRRAGVSLYLVVDLGIVAVVGSMVPPSLSFISGCGRSVLVYDLLQLPLKQRLGCRRRALTS